MAAATTAMIGVLAHAKWPTQRKNEEQTSERASHVPKEEGFPTSRTDETSQLTSRARSGNNKRTMGCNKGSKGA